jgi:hypothetical protein
MGKIVLVFGGNGHCAMRLEAARKELAGRPEAPELVEVPYPGFEGRPRAASLDAFLDALAHFCSTQGGHAAGYATGIGALFALGLRARGELRHPLIFQGPVLWGLKHRAFPRLMRSGSARKLLIWALTRVWFQDRLARRLFLNPLEDRDRARFFEGYARCPAFSDLFAWLSPGWLGSLERAFAERPEALGEITVWAGARDRVVGLEELRATECALGGRWPLVVQPRWGHYPMIDQPKEWADALCNALAGA